MVSKPSDSAKSRKLHGEQKSGDLGLLTCKINQLKKQIQAERVVFIKEKVEKNKKTVESDVSQLLSLAMSRTDDSSTDNSSLGKMLSTRIKNPLHLITGTAQGSCDNDNTSSQDVAICVTAKLPAVEKIPPYTAWIFVNRNQRMAEDQSVVGKRRIYYDQHGGEAIICSDNEEEIAVPDEEKHQFAVGENHIIRMVCQDYEPTEEVLKILTQFIGGTTSQIHEAYNTLKQKDEEKLNQNVSVRVEVEPDMSILLGKSLIASLDSFDTLFCRRCLVFDCRLHGYSQTIITPTERQRYPVESQEEGKPCSDQCYLQLQAVNKYPERLGGIGNSAIGTSEECMYEDSIGAGTADIIKDNGKEESKEITEVPVLNHASSQAEGSPTISQWKPLEKELYMKGLEIFGRNSCLIARNLLSGLKTCIEVYSYMHYIGSAMSRRSSTVCSTSNNNRKATDHQEQEMTSRLRLIRRKGRARKVKCSRSGHPLIWRQIADGKDQSYKQYTPCGCKSMCGKECPCVDNSTCCEKYCGCSKSCKNRFRGCHCAKSQCRSQQCPCFAAGRECDPDVCRNCWVSCGDGSLGEPPKRGEGECGNMRLLLMQQQRILLGKSDVAGWGAFLKNAVNKNDYLGEYTGELISHYEADMRGKLYDRANSSFLFNLNDQYVLDALRQGDKLKFANHSSKPNCYAKVAGDHRVGIFAKERIEAGEELFYDYCYGPEQSPIWALKPDGSKAEGSSVPQGRAKKNQSHQ